MVQAVSSQSNALQQTQQPTKADELRKTTQAAKTEKESRAEDRKENKEESTKVSLGQQGASGSVAPSRSPSQMYAAVSNIK